MQTILVIDDDESLRDTIGVMLEQEGFKAVLVGDGRQAMVWDRQALTVEVSREDSDNFRRNMVTILVEERLGLSVFAQGAFAYGPLGKVTPPAGTKAKANA